MKKFCFRSLLLVLLFLIIRFPDISINGASSGLLLWYQTVVPTLLPGMILSSLIVQTDAARHLISLIQPVLGRILHTSAEGSYCVIIGLLCGYPMGAKTCADYIRTGNINTSFGNYLMAFINYPSPIFLSGYLVTKHLGTPWLFHVLLSVYLPGLLLNAASFWYLYHKSEDAELKIQSDSAAVPAFSVEMLDTAISGSIGVIVKIGCYMMLFSLLSQFVQVLPCQNEWLRCFASGILEMTTGIHQLSLTGLSTQAQGAWMCGFAAFGGLSITMQVLSVIKDSELSVCSYLFWKLLHGCLSVLIFFFLF